MGAVWTLLTQVGRTLVWLDGLMIDWVFQPIINRFFGWSVVEFVRFFIVGVLALYVGDAVRCLLYSQMTALMWFALAVVVLLWSYLYVTIQHSFTMRPGVRNPERVAPGKIGLRLCYVVFTALQYAQAGVDFASVAFTLFVCYFYSRACDNPPPPQAKPARWWGRLALGRG